MIDWDEDQPVDADRLMKWAYEDAYQNPLILTADWGVHADSMPRVRAFAGNVDESGWGTYTTSREVEIIDGDEVVEVESAELIDEVAHAMIEGTRDRWEDRPMESSKVA